MTGYSETLPDTDCSFESVFRYERGEAPQEGWEPWLFCAIDQALGWDPFPKQIAALLGGFHEAAIKFLLAEILLAELTLPLEDA